jgi:hypothetical protein
MLAIAYSAQVVITVGTICYVAGLIVGAGVMVMVYDARTSRKPARPPLRVIPPTPRSVS